MAEEPLISAKLVRAASGATTVAEIRAILQIERIITNDGRGASIFTEEELTSIAENWKGKGLFRTFEHAPFSSEGLEILRSLGGGAPLAIKLIAYTIQPGYRTLSKGLEHLGFDLPQSTSWLDLLSSVENPRVTPTDFAKLVAAYWQGKNPEVGKQILISMLRESNHEHFRDQEPTSKKFLWLLQSIESNAAFTPAELVSFSKPENLRHLSPQRRESLVNLLFLRADPIRNGLWQEIEKDPEWKEVFWDYFTRQGKHGNLQLLTGKRPDTMSFGANYRVKDIRSEYPIALDPYVIHQFLTKAPEHWLAGGGGPELIFLAKHLMQSPHFWREENASHWLDQFVSRYLKHATNVKSIENPISRANQEQALNYSGAELTKVLTHALQVEPERALDCARRLVLAQVDDRKGLDRILKKMLSQSEWKNVSERPLLQATLDTQPQGRAERITLPPPTHEGLGCMIRRLLHL